MSETLLSLFCRLVSLGPRFPGDEERIEERLEVIRDLSLALPSDIRTIKPRLNASQLKLCVVYLEGRQRDSALMALVDRDLLGERELEVVARHYPAYRRMVAQQVQPACLAA